MSAGLAPRALSRRETKAVILTRAGFDQRAVAIRTGLSPAEIDHAIRLAIEWDIVRGDADYPIADWSPRCEPAPAPQPARRRARITALPLAHTPAADVLPEPELPKATPAPPPPPPAPRRRPRPAPKPSQTPPAPDTEPGSAAWTALATSPTVRRWAVADGWEVPARGQPLPGAIVLAYLKAHPEGP